jgi:hypothetical protein
MFIAASRIDSHSFNGDPEKAFSVTFFRSPNSVVQNGEFAKKGRKTITLLNVKSSRRSRYGIQ